MFGKLDLNGATKRVRKLKDTVLTATIPTSYKPDVVGSIPVTTEFFLIPVILIRSLSGSEPTIIWWSHYNVSKLFNSAGKSVFGVAPAIVQWAHYVAYV